MARTQGTAIENNFIKGLITETTALNFPVNAATETFNCIFDERGRVTRRPGIDLEEDYSENLVSGAQSADSIAYSEFLWKAAGGNGDYNLVVVQRGSTLYFYKADTTVIGISSNLLATTLDINDYLPSSPGGDPSTTSCQYAAGNGVLIVTNRYTDPFYVSYDEETDEITGTLVRIKYRDFIGIDDGLEIDERPLYGSVDELTAASGNAAHYYNLMNQGWHQQGAVQLDSAFQQWVSARDDVPSNADYMSLYRASFTDSFDNARVNAYTPGNTSAPKGHFILSLGEGDRELALLDGGLGLSSLFGAGSNFGGASNSDGLVTVTTGDISKAFNGDTDESGSSTASANASQCWAAQFNSGGDTRLCKAYAGKTLAAASKIVQGFAYGSNNRGFSYSFGTTEGGSYPQIKLSLYGKNGAAPTSYNDGTLLGSTGPFADPTNGSIGYRVRNTIDPDGLYEHAWIAFETTNKVTSSGGGAPGIYSYFVSEVQIYIKGEDTGSLFIPDETSERPETVAFYAGRAWYAGINEARFNNTLYFTQIIQQEDQYSKCYQQNDPTSEDLFDLLPSDGGTIRIVEAGGIQKIAVYYGALIVFALNGVWLIRGSGDGRGFTASDYRVEKVSSLGTQSPNSFVDVRGLPMWWGEDGILALNYNPQFDSFSVETITDDTIKTFYLDIPAYNRQFAKGAYDVNDQVVYWLYNNSANLAASESYVYNAVMCFNPRSSAFYPWTLSAGEGMPDIRGIIYAQDGGGISTSRMKYLVEFTDSDEEVPVLTWAEHDTGYYSDWRKYRLLDEGSALTDDDVEQTSYFITGYRLDGETMRYTQPNYLIMFFDYIADSSAYVQGIFDFTNSGNSGKWGTKQQAYNSTLTNRDVIMRRLKIRGKGRAVQFKVTSETDKPFSVIGWSTWATGNSEV